MGKWKKLEKHFYNWLMITVINQKMKSKQESINIKYLFELLDKAAHPGE